MLIAIVAILGALIPTAFYVLLVWWLDHFEKEPLWLLASAFLWGAIPAALLSLIAEVVLDIPVAVLGGESLAAQLISASFTAPLVEETFKSIALVGLVLTFRREFDDVLDGIIYGAMIGFGFAFTENSLAYFLPIMIEGGLQAGPAIIFLRSIVFGLNHALWTGIVGAAVGYARLAHERSHQLLVPIGGWLLAVTLHGIHNAGATLVEQTLYLSLAISLVVDWGGILLLFLLALLILRTESRWIELELGQEVQRGTLTAEEFHLLRSARARWAARWRAWRQGGRRAYRCLGHYFQCATELAFKKQHLRSLGDEGSTWSAGMPTGTAEIARLRTQLVIHRIEAEPWLSLEGG